MLAIALTALALSAAPSPPAPQANAGGPCPTDGVCEIPAAPTPIAVRLEFTADSEHGCSRSHASSSLSGTLTLTVSADDTASLVLDRRALSVFGPSLGEFRQGARDFTQQVEKSRSTWTGRARRTKDGLVIKLTKRRFATIEFMGPGDLPLPAETTVETALRLTCRRGTVDAYPAAPADGMYFDVHELSLSPLPVLLCTPPKGMDKALTPEFVGGGLPFGRSEGVRLYTRTSDYSDARLVRRTAQP